MPGRELPFKIDLYEYLRTNMFDGHDEGIVTMRASSLLDQTVQNVIEYLAYEILGVDQWDS